MQQGEDRGVGEEAGQRKQNLLAAAEAGEPVVNERGSGGGGPAH
jgi:hypothetical protein